MARQRQFNDGLKMRQRKADAKRPRVSVSLDQEDFEWIQSFKGPSESYTVSRMIKAARLAGLTLDSSMSGGVLQEFRDWLKTKRKRSRTADEVCDLITDYLGYE